MIHAGKCDMCNSIMSHRMHKSDIQPRRYFNNTLGSRIYIVPEPSEPRRLNRIQSKGISQEAQEGGSGPIKRPGLAALILAKGVH